MFLKLLKYDFKSVFFKLIPAFIVLLIFAVACRFINLLTFESSVAILMKFITNLAFLMVIVGADVFAIVIIVMRYTKSLFKDQGYLTHTLPVSKHKLLLSQLLVSFIAFILLGVVTVVSLLIAYLNSDFFNTVQEIIYSYSQILITPETIVIDLIMSVLSSTTSAIKTILIVFLGIALGHIHSNRKNLMSIIYCGAIYFGIYLFTNLFNVIFFENFEMSNIYDVVVIIENIIISVLAYCTTIFTMNRQLNLE